MNESRRVLALSLALGILAALVCTLPWPAAYLDGEFLPVGNDSFYHSRRIVDAATDPASFYQFDQNIHAPEGSLLVWPWAYDYLMGRFVRIAMKAGVSTDPMAIIVWIPVASVFVSMLLMVSLARQLSLGWWPTVLAGLCVALSPLTQYLHGIGFIDHHYAEYMFILATLVLGLRWIRALHSPSRAVALGVVLGIALGIHNGLFVLQIPVLVAIGVLWLQRVSIPLQPVICFGSSLVVTTTIVLVPSLPFQLGHFEFYTLSWFHLYIAAGTFIALVLVSLLPFTARNVAFIVAIGLLMLLPLAREVVIAQSFLAGTIKRLDSISEMISPLKAVRGPGGRHLIGNFYSWLIFVTPLTFLLCIYYCWHERSSYRVFFWVSCIGGLALLSMQLRMHYFGSFALYLPLLIGASELSNWRPQWHRTVWLSTSLALLLLYIYPLRYQLAAPLTAANDFAFKDVRPMLSTLQKVCKDAPGTVLADNDAGHYIRYYSNCPVIANNFLLTPQQAAKIEEIDWLFSLSAEDFLTRSPEYVEYILVRPVNILRTDEKKFTYVSFGKNTSKLVADLLLRPADAVPSGYELLHEIRFDGKTTDIPYARLYRVTSRKGRAAETSPPTVN